MGSVLVATSGTWNPAGAYAYQWLREGDPISGATAPNYAPVASDVGKALKVRVTASKAGYTSASATSAGVVVQAGTIANNAVPVISGTPQPGSTLTGSTGTWSPSASYVYQWLLDDVPIAGATTSSYSPLAGDVGETVKVRVTASKAGYTTTSATSAGVVIEDAPVFVMEPLAAPSISGTPRVGVALTASPGQWSPAGSYAYQWLVNGVVISGATGQKYTPSAGTLGKRISVRVTASKEGYTSSTLTSAQTGTVAAGIIRCTVAPKITGVVKVGRYLTASNGSWTPGGLTYRYQWYRNGVAISGATAKTYKLTAASRGKRITVKVTARRTGYTTASKVSGATVRVT